MILNDDIKRKSARMQYVTLFDSPSCDQQMRSNIKIFSCYSVLIIRPIGFKLHKSISDEGLDECCITFFDFRNEVKSQY